MALYLSDMTSTKFAGIFLTLLVLLNFPISFFAGYLIEFFPKNLYYFINFNVDDAFRHDFFYNIIEFDNYILCFYVIFNIVWGYNIPQWILLSWML